MPVRARLTDSSGMSEVFLESAVEVDARRRTASRVRILHSPAKQDKAEIGSAMLRVAVASHATSHVVRVRIVGNVLERLAVGGKVGNGISVVGCAVAWQRRKEFSAEYLEVIIGLDRAIGLIISCSILFVVRLARGRLVDRFALDAYQFVIGPGRLGIRLEILFDVACYGFMGCLVGFDDFR